MRPLRNNKDDAPHLKKKITGPDKRNPITLNPAVGNCPSKFKIYNSK